MSEHIPCEHCEEVRQEEEVKIFGKALAECLKMERGTAGRETAEHYMEQLFRPSPFDFFPKEVDKDKPVKFMFWSDV